MELDTDLARRGREVLEEEELDDDEEEDVLMGSTALLTGTSCTT